MSLLPVGISGEEAGYQIERSLRFNSADSAYLSRTPSGTGGRSKFTYSIWLKVTKPSTQIFLLSAPFSTTQNGSTISIESTGQFYAGLRLYNTGSQGTFDAECYSNMLFRDPSAWYHIVFSLDTTASSADAMKLYVNGVSQSFASYDAPTASSVQYIGSEFTHYIGSLRQSVGTLDGYLAETHFIDGQALNASYFGEYNTDTGVWQPKAYTGSYSGNSFYLNFSDNSGTTSTTLGKDYSGNGNNWTPNNFSVTAGAGNDSLVDTPTPYGTDTGVGGEVRGNYATLNPLSISGTPTLSNGNLDIAYTGSAGNYGAIGTLGVSSGKWYFETTLGSDADFYVSAGFLPVDSQQVSNIANTLNSNFVTGSYVDALDLRRGTGSSSTRVALSSTTPASGGVIGVSFDIDAGEMRFYYNGTQLNVAITSGIVTGKTWVPFVGLFVNDGMSVNFGQRPFAYTAPSGFKALCTQNLPEPTIVDGGQYFNTVLYTGDGTSSRAITGVGFQPDMVWTKRRSGADNHHLFDAVRVVSSVPQRLFPNLTNAEDGNFGSLDSFNADGFTIGSNVATNASGETFAAWNWKANGAGVSNTDGTITSTVSANTDSGFSIVTYTGTGSAATVGHGLGVAPSMVIVKKRSATGNWVTWHTGLTGSNPEDRLIYLDLTNAQTAVTDYWGTAGMTSTTFGVWASGGDNNASGSTFVAYCFAVIPGYSAFGSYTGTGSADGPFVFTNHRPAYLLIKRTDSADDWSVYDNTRSPYNQRDELVYANSSNAETANDTSHAIDFLSNGFKCRGTSVQENASGGTYIYMSFASNPFRYSLAA